MAETTQLELVTPARIMAQKSVQMVVAPGVEGLFGVLPRHAQRRRACVVDNEGCGDVPWQLFGRA